MVTKELIGGVGVRSEFTQRGAVGCSAAPSLLLEKALNHRHALGWLAWGAQPCSALSSVPGSRTEDRESSLLLKVVGIMSI